MITFGFSMFRLIHLTGYVVVVRAVSILYQLDSIFFFLSKNENLIPFQRCRMAHLAMSSPSLDPLLDLLLHLI